jgi:hypothetical protein
LIAAVDKMHFKLLRKLKNQFYDNLNFKGKSRQLAVRAVHSRFFCQKKAKKSSIPKAIGTFPFAN